MGNDKIFSTADTNVGKRANYFQQSSKEGGVEGRGDRVEQKQIECRLCAPKSKTICCNYQKTNTKKNLKFSKMPFFTMLYFSMALRSFVQNFLLIFFG